MVVAITDIGFEPGSSLDESYMNNPKPTQVEFSQPGCSSSFLLKVELCPNIYEPMRYLLVQISLWALLEDIVLGQPAPIRLE
jgi:hypothetical protein